MATVTFKKIEVLPRKSPAPVKMTETARRERKAPASVPAPSAPVTVEPTAGHLPKLSGEFLLAGRALFTVSNGSGEHYTYKVRMRESEFPVGSGRRSKSFFLSVKSSAGVWPYSYVGILNPTEGTIKCTAKSNFLPGTKEYDVAAWACRKVIKGGMIPENYQIDHAGKCGRCGRTLTDPQSIERGIGPECWSIMGH